MKTKIFILALLLSTAISSLQAQVYPEMITVEGGTFTMGDTEMDGIKNEQPAHKVMLKTFSIAKTETTVLQWRTFCNATGRNFPRSMEGKADEVPIAAVNWHDAVAYADWLTKITGKNYRLPTEAEWEYAARGGNKSKGFTYSGSRVIDDVSWYISNSENSTKKVATKKPNELGIYDMSGNLWEWCYDWFDGNYYADSPKDDPKGPATGIKRVIRGGNWDSERGFSRVSTRISNYPDSQFNGQAGFRVARSQ